MLTGIDFKNYKAFEEGHLEIRPLTMLLGANSVGKSSLIQLFLMFQETALAVNYKSALKLHGNFFSLGEGINLFRKKDLKNELHFCYSFDELYINEMIRQEYFKRFVNEITDYCFFILARFSNKESDLKFFEVNSNKYKATKAKNKKLGEYFNTDNLNKYLADRNAVIDLLNLTHDTLKRNKNTELVKETFKWFFYARASSSIGSNILNNLDEVIETYDFLRKLNEIENLEKVKIEYNFKYTDGILKIKSFKMILGNTIVVSIEFDNVADHKQFVTSNIIDTTKFAFKYNAELRKIFSNNKTVFSFIEPYEINDQNQSILLFYFVNSIKQIINKLEESFSSQNINYVSPLRAHPKRYYFLDKARVNLFLDTLDGEAIAEIIKDNSALKVKVNEWFKKFNLHIDVGPIKDIIHHIVVQQNSLDLDITDVGFGVSQILPVIIQGFISKEHSVTLIEQPEIHLHPKMQADLADLFIDIAVKKNVKNAEIPSKYLIIETHSEYLLKRLRRRISEGKILSENVAIYYIEPQEGSRSAVIKRMSISEKGAFDWPKDYYTGDLGADVTEFLKNQV